MQEPSASATQSVTKAATDVGQVFVQGRTDGLILYSLVLLSFFLFLALIASIWIAARQTTKTNDTIKEISESFAAASKQMADALKDIATASASAASVETTFRQVLSPKLDRIGTLLTLLERHFGIGD